MDHPRPRLIYPPGLLNLDGVVDGCATGTQSVGATIVEDIVVGTVEAWSRLVDQRERAGLREGAMRGRRNNLDRGLSQLCGDVVRAGRSASRDLLFVERGAGHRAYHPTGGGAAGLAAGGRLEGCCRHILIVVVEADPQSALTTAATSQVDGKASGVQLR